MLLIQELEGGRAKPLVFVLNANLLALVKLVNCTFLCRIKMSQILFMVSYSHRLITILSKTKSSSLTDLSRILL